MKATTQYNVIGLKNRSELLGTELESNGSPAGANKSLQLGLGLTPVKGPLKPAHPFRLRAGDVVLYNHRICPVLRVNDCCALIEMAQAAREFTTIFGKLVRIKPKPKLVRIASNSEIPILKRCGQGGRK
jgi:hypothetical protein